MQKHLQRKIFAQRTVGSLVSVVVIMPSLRLLQGSFAPAWKKKEDFVFISGIGCSGRFPYYVEPMDSTPSTAARRHIHGR
ncbi:MAG: hypothetical protein R3B47_09605 [Bacteroidia bacterium]